MGKRRLPPDNRLDWRDPDMPVLDDGVAKTPEQFQRERTMYLVNSMGKMASRHFPDWKDDPSYFWKERKSK